MPELFHPHHQLLNSSHRRNSESSPMECRSKRNAVYNLMLINVMVCTALIASLFLCSYYQNSHGYQTFQSTDGRTSGGVEKSVYNVAVATSRPKSDNEEEEVGIVDPSFNPCALSPAQFTQLGIHTTIIQPNSALLYSDGRLYHTLFTPAVTPNPITAIADCQVYEDNHPFQVVYLQWSRKMVGPRYLKAYKMYANRFHPPFVEYHTLKGNDTVDQGITIFQDTYNSTCELYIAQTIHISDANHSAPCTLVRDFARKLLSQSEPTYE